MSLAAVSVVARRLFSSSASGAASVAASATSAAPTTKAKVKRYSGAQKEVLALYRSWMRAIHSKSADKQRQAAMVRHVRSEFKAHAVSVRLLDVERVERLITRGRKQLRAFRISSGGFDVTDLSDSSVVTEKK
jgi:hypothetical protein